jgi:hypothetical protein
MKIDKRLGLNSTLSRRGGMAKGRIGGIVHSEGSGLCAVACAHLFPSDWLLSGDRREIWLQDCLPHGVLSAPRQRHVPVSHALSVFAIPSDVYVDPGWAVTALAQVDHICSDDALCLRSSDETYMGKLGMLDVPFRLIAENGDQQHFSGAIEVELPAATDAKRLRMLSGSAVWTRSRLLVGFMIAADQTSFLVAPAETFLAERALRMATNQEIALHNSVAAKASNKALTQVSLGRSPEASAQLANYGNLQKLEEQSIAGWLGGQSSHHKRIVTRVESGGMPDKPLLLT